MKITGRLSRSLEHLIDFGADLHASSVGLHVLEQGIDSATPDGRAMFGCCRVPAELQRELIVANTNDG